MAMKRRSFNYCNLQYSKIYSTLLRSILQSYKQALEEKKEAWRVMIEEVWPAHVSLYKTECDKFKASKDKLDTAVLDISWILSHYKIVLIWLEMAVGKTTELTDSVERFEKEMDENMNLFYFWRWSISELLWIIIYNSVLQNLLKTL